MTCIYSASYSLINFLRKYQVWSNSCPHFNVTASPQPSQLTWTANEISLPECVARWPCLMVPKGPHYFFSSSNNQFIWRWMKSIMMHLYKTDLSISQSTLREVEQQIKYLSFPMAAFYIARKVKYIIILLFFVILLYSYIVILLYIVFHRFTYRVSQKKGD